MNKLLLIIVFFIATSGYTQVYEWYYPFDKEIKNIDNGVVPILLSGNNYRILKLHSSKEIILDDIHVICNLNKVEVFLMPKIKNYRTNKPVYDLLIPFSSLTLLSNQDYYFLIKFNGIEIGEEKVEFILDFHGEHKSIFKDVIVGEYSYDKNLSLNVWSYFDYDFITNGLKNQIIDDLQDHNVNMIVVPPFHLPKVQENIEEDRLNKLRNYIEGTEFKFEYYLLYLGYTEQHTKVMEEQWMSDFPIWLERINEIFVEYNIPANKVLIYPFDEPKGNSIQVLSDMLDFTKSLDLKNPFYATIGGKDREKALFLINKLDFAQVANKIVPRVKQNSKDINQIFSYAVMGGGRNIAPFRYVDLSRQAYEEDLKGIGVWQYSDMKRALNTTLTKDSIVPSTWELVLKDYTKDYSLVYRQNNTLFASLRWEALSYGLQEYKFLVIYENYYGRVEALKLASKLRNSKFPHKKWEQIKMDLLRKSL